MRRRSETVAMERARSPWTARATQGAKAGGPSTAQIHSQLTLGNAVDMSNSVVPNNRSPMMSAFSMAARLKRMLSPVCRPVTMHTTVLATTSRVRLIAFASNVYMELDRASLHEVSRPPPETPWRDEERGIEPRGGES